MIIKYATFFEFFSKILTKKDGMFYYIIEIQLDAIIFQLFSYCNLFIFSHFERVSKWVFCGLKIFDLIFIIYKKDKFI